MGSRAVRSGWLVTPRVATTPRVVKPGSRACGPGDRRPAGRASSGTDCLASSLRDQVGSAAIRALGEGPRQPLPGLGGSYEVATQGADGFDLRSAGADPLFARCPGAGALQRAAG